MRRNPTIIVLATEKYRGQLCNTSQRSGNLGRIWPSRVLAVLFTMLFISAAMFYVQPEGGHSSDHNHHGASIVSGWEGSAQGLAYSEFNHHLAGLFVLLMGCAELGASLRMPSLSSLSWARLLLPTMMLFGSVLLMVGSDHDAWPTGSLSFAQTFTGHDPEVLQHKIYGVLLFSVGTIETLRRVGRISNVWSPLLPLFAIGGGLMLFGHSHGIHPSAEKIAMHHAIIGTMAVTAGLSKLLSNRLCFASQTLCWRLEWLWAGLILLIGIQLLVYSE
jgi:putative copper resistance protein D